MRITQGDRHILFLFTGKQHLKVLKELRDIITARPLRFHAANFYRLDYSLLTAMASLGVTYSIIILQIMQT